MPYSPHLTPLDTPPSPIPLADETTIGRAPEHSLCLAEDESVSRSHARIRRHLGLFLLEDLGSTNGTFLTPPGGEETRLTAGEPGVLLEGVILRIGLNARFEARDLLPAQGDEGFAACSAVHERLLDGYAQLLRLDGKAGKALADAIRRYEKQLAAATDLPALLNLANQEIRPLTQTVFGSLDSEDLGAFDQELPPLDDDLPDPAAPKPMTVKGTLLPGMLEDETGSDDNGE